MGTGEPPPLGQRGRAGEPERAPPQTHGGRANQCVMSERLYDHDPLGPGSCRSAWWLPRPVLGLDLGLADCWRSVAGVGRQGEGIRFGAPRPFPPELFAVMTCNKQQG